MTTAQQRRLALAETVCGLSVRQLNAIFDQDENPAFHWRPTIIAALQCMRQEVQRMIEAEYKNTPAAEVVSHLADFEQELRTALESWMKACGMDPKTQYKSEAQRVAMDLAKRAYGPEYEGEAEPIPGSDLHAFFSRKTAEERAAPLANEISSGRLKGYDEIRIAIAAEVLEAEYQTREPFVKHATTIFQACEDAKVKTELNEKVVADATSQLLVEAGRWVTVHRRSEQQEATA